MSMLLGNSPDAVIRQIRDTDEAWQRLGAAVGLFLHAAYPHVGARICGAVGDAIITLGTVGSEHQIETLSKLPKPEPAPPPEVNLVRLCEYRDQMTAQMENMERAASEFGDDNPAKALIHTALLPLKMQLETIERQISAVQKGMEEQEGEK